ncbi:MAG: GNAT family N-acetyltransferase [Actinomycetota bacterium]|nr:GNAT family N-acetyltransferase [Actinomycetota bacterium]
MDHPLSALWPLVDLRIRVGDIELRLPEEADLAALAALAAAGIHDPAKMPFSTPWSDAPPDERARSVVQWHWKGRAEWTPPNWHLQLVTVKSGQIVGTQSIQAKDFAITREVDTGSWLGRAHQGGGVGTAMRAGVLHLAFSGLGATAARSGAFTDNPASRRVSEKLGYQADGTETLARRGAPASLCRWILTRSAWEASANRPVVEIAGLSPCLELFGAL